MWDNIVMDTSNTRNKVLRNSAKRFIILALVVFVIFFLRKFLISSTEVYLWYAAVGNNILLGYLVILGPNLLFSIGTGLVLFWAIYPYIKNKNLMLYLSVIIIVIYIIIASFWSVVSTPLVQEFYKPIVEYSKIISKCNDLPHQSLVEYCQVRDEISSGDYKACESLEVIPQNYYNEGYVEKDLSHVAGLFGKDPVGGEETLRFSRAKCYDYITTTLVNPELSNRFHEINDFTNQDNSFVRQTCNGFKNVDLKNLCYYHAVDSRINEYKLNRLFDNSICEYIENNNILQEDCYNIIEYQQVDKK